MQATKSKNSYKKPIEAKDYHRDLSGMVYVISTNTNSSTAPTPVGVPYVSYGYNTKITKPSYITTLKKSVKKYALSLGILSLSAIPVTSLMAVSGVTPITKFDNITNKQEIIVATTASNSTLFQDGDILHGFGYDVAKHYAEHLGVSMVLKTYDDEQEALNALKSGEVDMALSTLVHDDSEIATSPIACDQTTQDALSDYGLDSGVGFTFLTEDQKMLQHSAEFLCQPEQLVYNQSVAKFYDRTLFENAYSEKHFKRALTQQLPIYKHAFKAGAKKHNHDWQLLAVISYQESHLNPNATSFTGVQGLMMLTNETAKEMGVTNRTDAVQSIQGGAKYLAKLEKMFMDVPESERVWFVLASYNMGPNAVKNIQSELEKQGKDANNWSQVYAYLAQNADSNSRYVQCMHYVTNIRTYLEAIKEMQA